VERLGRRGSEHPTAQCCDGPPASEVYAHADEMAPRDHSVHAVAFEESLRRKEIAPHFPNANVTAYYSRAEFDTLSSA